MNHPAILGLATAVRGQCYPQADLYEMLHSYLGVNPKTSLIFANSGVGYRYLAIDDAYYQQERGTGERNELYLTEAMLTGERAIRACLENSGHSLSEVGDFTVVSCTGIDIPGLDLRLAGKLGMAADLRRTCVLGMGCYGAFPGLLRAREAVLARPDRLALLLAVEICSVHFQPGDSSLENIVSSALFGDGAAALLVGAGKNLPGPKLLDSATYCDYQTFEHMAFHLTDHGFRMSLSAYVPRLLAANVENFVDGLLARSGLTRRDIPHWGVHPGSSKILDFIEARLGLPAGQLDPSRRVLFCYGNMSSATILFVLDEIQRTQQPHPGDYGVLLSFGPGLTMEGALVQW